MFDPWRGIWNRIGGWWGVAVVAVFLLLGAAGLFEG